MLETDNNIIKEKIVANIQFNNSNQNLKNINMSSLFLNFNDLENLLNVNSINIPIDKRIKKDFLNIKNKTFSLEEKNLHPIKFPSMKLIEPIELNNSPYLSSPLNGDEFIVPYSLNNIPPSFYTLTPNKKNFRNKTHKSHYIFKKNKSKKSKSGKYIKSKTNKHKLTKSMKSIKSKRTL